MDISSFLLDNLEAAGVIGGYVAISIIGIALITAKMSDKIVNTAQIGPKKIQPIIGALLGVIPGCGGTIVVSTLYKNKQISFGALFAAFITTLGEGSFVLLGASDESDVAGNLTAFAIVSVICLLTGALFGAVADGLKINVNSENAAVVAPNQLNNPENSMLARGFVENAGFYMILGSVVFLTPGSIMALWGGGIDAIADLTVFIAIFLTLVSIFYYLVYRFALMENCCSSNKNGLRATLLHSIADLSMVVMYVFIGLVVANFIIDILVGPERFDAWMTSSTMLVILLAALVGVMPGCGGMIAVAAAFVTIPNFPLAALIAAAIATSGDGIFPLIAQNKKDALVISLASFCVAVLVGYLSFLLPI